MIHARIHVMLLALSCIGLAASSHTATAQKSDSVSLQVSLVTVGPGSEIFSWLGHSGVLITYPGGEQREFDYGVMFASSATTRAVLTGTGDAHLAMSEGRSKIATWVRRGRSVRVQPLDLTSAQKTKLLRLLEADHDERRGYRYDLITDNCTTHIRDLIDAATDGALRRAGSAASGSTVREIGIQQIRKSWVIAMFDLVLNDAVDRPATRWEAASVPAGLSRLVSFSSVPGADSDRRALISQQPTISITPEAESRIGVGELSVLLLLIGLAIASVTLALGLMARRVSALARFALGFWIATVGGMVGLLGLTVGAGWLLTEYPFAPHNENLFVLNPLLLFAVPLGVNYALGVPRSARWLGWLLDLCAIGSVACVVLKATPDFDQSNLRILFLATPTMVSLALAHRVASGLSLRETKRAIQVRLLVSLSVVKKPAQPASAQPISWRYSA